MGQLFSRSRKKTSVTDILEQFEKEIKVFEDYQRSTEQKQKHLIGSLILYSIILYIVLGTVPYIYWFPSTLREQFLYSIPLLLFPILIWLLKKILQKYFRWKIKMNADQLTELLRKRRSILNDVKENETYKKAKEILEKFDPEYKLQEQKKKAAEQILAKTKEVARAAELRRRSVPVRGVVQQCPVPVGNVHSGSMQMQQGFVQNGRQWVRPPGPPMARPILPRERKVTDRLVDYLVGDGPHNRYALICRQCLSHNGMALKEEFEYIAFRCCYCYVLNPARKERPQAPSLPTALPPQLPALSQVTETEEESKKGEELEMETPKSGNEPPQEEESKSDAEEDLRADTETAGDDPAKPPEETENEPCRESETGDGSA